MLQAEPLGATHSQAYIGRACCKLSLISLFHLSNSHGFYFLLYYIPMFIIMFSPNYSRLYPLASKA